jgi:anti-sigma B factor antagonist
MELSFDISVTPACAVLELKGRIISTDDTAAIIERAEAIIANGTSNWICDLGGVSYCNSTGLNLFVRMLTKTRNAGGDCVLADLQPAVAKLFELSKLNEIFTSFAGIETAKERFKTTA